jgi:hypothetical protein
MKKKRENACVCGGNIGPRAHDVHVGARCYSRATSNGYLFELKWKHFCFSFWTKHFCFLNFIEREIETLGYLIKSKKMIEIIYTSKF